MKRSDFPQSLERWTFSLYRRDVFRGLPRGSRSLWTPKDHRIEGGKGAGVCVPRRRRTSTDLKR